jgi:dienelactone hydrolase
VVSLDEAVMNRKYERGVRLFTYDATLPLNATERVRSRSADFTRLELSYASPAGGRVPATVFVPREDGPFPALILQHGLPGSRSDMLFIARDYAASGVLTLSLDAPFARGEPTTLTDPISFTRRDRRDQIQLIVDLRRAVDYLLRRDDVDPDRVGYLGISYGAAMGGLLAGVERRIVAYALLVGDGGLVEHHTGPDAQAGSLDFLDPHQRRHWLFLMEPIEPIYYVGHAAPAELLFQSALHDEAVTVEDAVRFQEAGSEPKQVRWYESGHLLPVEAVCYTWSWLERQLSFVGIPRSIRCPG